MSDKGHFATMLSGHTAKRGMSTRDVEKVLGISYEHARRLQAGESLPSPLLIEKMANTIGLPQAEANLAAQRDRMLRKYGAQLLAENSGISERAALFEPLINALDPDDVRPALSMLRGLVDGAQIAAAQPAPVTEVLKQFLPKKTKRKEAAAVRENGKLSGRPRQNKVKQ
jgi:transcriptional regulator with XRE-family HTH domain